MKVKDAGSNTEKLIIEYGSHTNEDCDQLRSLVDSEAFPMPLHGILISY